MSTTFPTKPEEMTHKLEPKELQAIRSSEGQRVTNLEQMYIIRMALLE